MPRITFPIATKWVFFIFLFLCIGLQGCVEKNGTNRFGGNLFSDAWTLSQAHRDLKKVWQLTRWGKYSEAEKLAESVLKVYKDQLGEEHTSVATCLNSLGIIYEDQGRYSEAEKTLLEALAIAKKTYGLEHLNTAASLNNLGIVYKEQAQYAKSEKAYREALVIREKILGTDHPTTAGSWVNLSTLYDIQGRFMEAEEAQKRALMVFEKKLGPNHPNTATAWNNLGNILLSQGRYAETEQAYKKALAIEKHRFEDNHPRIAITLNNLGNVYTIQAKYVKSEQAYREALVIREKNLGTDHPLTAVSWTSIGIVYESQGRFQEAEQAHNKALMIFEKGLGPNHPDTARAWINLGNVLLSQGRYAETEQAYKKALAIKEDKLGSEHIETAWAFSNLGSVYESQGKYAEAELVFKRVLGINQAILGTEHPSTANSWENLGIIYESQERYEEAEQAHKNALAIRKEKLGDDHPDTANSLSYLSRALLGTTESVNTAEALVYIRKATSIIDRRFQAASRRKNETSEGKTYRWIHETHLEALSQSRSQGFVSPESHINESFIAAQRTRNSTVAKAISRMTARLAAGRGELEDLASKQQALADQIVSAERSMISAYSTDNVGLADKQQIILTGLMDELAETEATLARHYPDYYELSYPAPIPIEEAQSLLYPGEALLVVITDEDQSYLWTIRDSSAEWWTLPVKEESIEEIVKAVREELRPSSITDLSDIPQFPVEKSQELYNLLIAPASKMLQGAKRVFVVADGSLQSLPFEVMINGGKKQASIKDLNWLTKEYALAYLPSVSSLKALRTLRAKNAAPDPFIGFGDPLLETNGGMLRVASVFDRRGTGLADINGINQLPSLPETADELNSLAAILNASPNSVYLQENATEKKLKQTDLSSVKVLAFATHGLLAGDFEFLGEPALVLTPPDQASVEDDGLLTAGEVTQLRLNADWVVLSACNTASADGTPGAEGFSGLTKAFFYAGAKTLLVSHWPVESNSAMQLTTSLFDNLRKNPHFGKAEALRQARLQMIYDTQHPYLSHPAFWAPFVVVGEARNTH